MGVDAFLFDSQSKTCIYFDRKYNLYDGDLDIDVYGPVWDKLRDPLAVLGRGGAEASELLAYIEATTERRISVGDEPNYLPELKKFTEERPNGLFFVATDHDGGKVEEGQMPYCHDIIDSGYKEIPE